MKTLVLLTVMISSGPALGADSIAIPKSMYVSISDPLSVPTTLATLKASANLSAKGLQFLNFLGKEVQITQGLEALQPEVFQLLADSGLPGVLLYFEQEIATSETPITLIVGDKPQLIGAGLDAQSVWNANAANSARPMPANRPGYRSEPGASFFIWVKLENGAITYRFQVPAGPVLAEGRRVYADTRLYDEQANRYATEVRYAILKKAESNAATAELRDKARSLVKAADKARSDLKAANEQLQHALDEARRLDQRAAVFQTMASILGVVNAARGLLEEFPDAAGSVGKPEAATIDSVRSALQAYGKELERQGGSYQMSVRSAQSSLHEFDTEAVRFIGVLPIPQPLVPGVNRIGEKPVP